MCTSLASVPWSNGMRIASAKSSGKSTELKNFTSRSVQFIQCRLLTLYIPFSNLLMELKEYIELFNNITSSFLVIPKNHY